MASESTEVMTPDVVYDFSCSPCSVDGKNTDALYQCVVCEMFYCQVCIDAHSKYTNNHSVIDKRAAQFGKAPKQTATRSSKLPSDGCEEHEGELIKMFCGQHDEVCCAICIALKHRSCKDVDYIPNVSKGLMQTEHRKRAVTSLEVMKNDLKNLKSKMQKELLMANKQHESTICDIQKFKQNIFAKIIELEKKSIEEAQKKQKEITDGIHVFSENVDTLLEGVVLRLEKLKSSVNNNEAQIFVDVKYGEKEILEAQKCIKTSQQRSVRSLNFYDDPALTKWLLTSPSLGIVTDFGSTPSSLGGLVDKTITSSTELFGKNAATNNMTSGVSASGRISTTTTESTGSQIGTSTGSFHYGSSIVRNEEFHWEGLRMKPITIASGSAKVTSEGCRGENVDVKPGKVHYFEPVVPLPDLVDVKTGEEDETIEFSNRAKLFKFDTHSNKWKEKGIGQMKILKHKESGKYRLLLRREQVHKIAINHMLTRDIKMTPLKFSKLAFCWTAQDYAEAEMKVEHLAVKLKDMDSARDFKQKVDELQTLQQLQES